MRILKAFVAKSFRAVDHEKIAPITELLDSFGPLGLVCETADRAEIESVSKKVQQKIDDCDVFVAIFTRRHPIFFADLDNGNRQFGETPVPSNGQDRPGYFKNLVTP